MTAIFCRKCAKTLAPPKRVPYPEPLASEVRAHTCVACWDEWKEEEVRVINELRLNFIDPEAQKTLVAAMRRFLVLDSDS